jgi:hypothetical protein
LVAAESVVELANVAAASSNRLTAVVEERLTGDRLDYDAVYAGASEWH